MGWILLENHSHSVEVSAEVIGRVKLSYDELMIVLVDMEATLNSRPISYISSQNFEEPITPLHLLIGCHILTIPIVATHEENPDFIGMVTYLDLTRHMQHLSQVMEHFWRRWRSEYLTALRERHSYNPSVREPKGKMVWERCCAHL